MLDALRATLIDTIYPPRCLACTVATDAAHGLCPTCWRETFFVAGAACWKCGVPLVGEAERGDLCDGCTRRPPAWDRGAAALVYGGAGRRMVLAFKHGDRLDLAEPFARWMASAGAELLAEADAIAPVPLHWRRLVARRYNQSAEIARRLARGSGKPAIVDLLRRCRHTAPQKNLDLDARAANQAGAVVVTPRRAALIAGRTVLVVDDVMTSGATLAGCAEALRAAGAARVHVLVLARVAFAEDAHI